MTLRTSGLSSRVRTATHVDPVASELSSPVMVKPGTIGCAAMANPYCLDMATDAPTHLGTSGGYRDHDSCPQGLQRRHGLGRRPAVPDGYVRSRSGGRVQPDPSEPVLDAEPG